MVESCSRFPALPNYANYRDLHNRFVRRLFSMPFPVSVIRWKQVPPVDRQRSFVATQVTVSKTPSSPGLSTVNANDHDDHAKCAAAPPTATPIGKSVSQHPRLGATSCHSFLLASCCPTSYCTRVSHPIQACHVFRLIIAHPALPAHQ
jgi:hypothetical protein